jgi:predicted nucleic-acid-binding Zn-ribbon protein
MKATCSKCGNVIEVDIREEGLEALDLCKKCGNHKWHFESVLIPNRRRCFAAVSDNHLKKGD